MEALPPGGGSRRGFSLFTQPGDEAPSSACFVGFGAGVMHSFACVVSSSPTLDTTGFRPHYIPTMFITDPKTEIPHLDGLFLF